MNSATVPGILDGLVVVDMATGLAGPVAAMLLAEVGAEVIKVEPPGGDTTRALPGFAVWNRSKASIVLDDSTAARRQLERLLAEADVLVHDLRPSVAATRGFDDATLARRFPRLVSCAVTPYPDRHPDRDRPGTEASVMARLGIVMEQTGHRDGPVFVRFPLGSWGAAYLAANGIMARLLRREDTGRGGAVHTSIAQGALVPLAMHWARAERPSERMAAGFHGEAVALFECADGTWIHIMHAPDHVPLMQEVLAELGSGRVDAANRAGPARTGFPNFGAYQVAFRQRPSNQWLDALWDADVPAQPALPMGELLRDHQARLNGYLVDVTDHRWGPTTQPGSPLDVDPPPAVRSAAPLLDEHGERIRGRLAAALPSPQGEAPALPNDEPPLAGLTVLDFGNFLAGPLAPMLLADLGADVVKVEAAAGDQMRWHERVFAGCQRGKRSVAMDLRDPATRPALETLIRSADVVHHNIRRPAAHRLGIHPEQLRRINPDIVFCHVNSYGTRGPRADWPGYDQMFQASAGWEYESAGEGNPPVWSRFGMMDHQAAMASLLATLLALYQRRRTGHGQDVSASLLGASLLTTSETMLCDGKLVPYPQLDTCQTGLGVTRRLYQCRDGWVMVDTPGPRSAEELAEAVGADDADTVESRVRRQPVVEVATLARNAGFVSEIVPVDAEQAFLDDADNQMARLVVATTHPTYGRLEQVGAFWSFDDTDVVLDRHPPALGEHTYEVLDEVGVPSQDIDELIGRGIAVQFVAHDGDPPRHSSAPSTAGSAGSATA